MWWLALVGGAAAAVDPSITWQVHSFNDLRLWPQMLRKGATWTKIDLHLMSGSECAAQGLPDTKTCFFLNHDTPEPGLRHYNTSDDLIKTLASQDLRPYFLRPFSIALCFKNAPSPQCGSAAGQRWVEAVDDLFVKASALMNTLRLQLSWVLDGDAWPRNCTTHRWEPWQAVWVPGRAPQGAFTSDDRALGFDRYTILNTDVPHYPEMLAEGFGKFSRGPMPFLVWEPSDEDTMLSVAGSYASSAAAARKGGLRMAINIDPGQAQVYLARASGRGWHAPLPGNLSVAGALAAVPLAPSAFAGVAVDGARGAYSSVLAKSTATAWQGGAAARPLPALGRGLAAPTAGLRATPMPVDACRTPAGRPCGAGLLVCGSGGSGGSDAGSGECAAYSVDPATGALSASEAGGAALAVLPPLPASLPAAPGAELRAARPLLGGGAGGAAYLVQAWAAAAGGHCAVHVRLVVVRGKAAEAMSEAACVGSPDAPAVASLDVAGSIVAGDACGNYGSGQCAAAVVAWADASGHALAGIVAIPVALDAPGEAQVALRATGPWHTPARARPIGAGRSVRLALAPAGLDARSTLAQGDAVYNAPSMSNVAATIAIGDGFCFNSEVHNKQAGVAVCDQVPQPTAGVVNYVAGTVAQLVAVLLVAARRRHGWLTPCSPYVVVGTADVGSRPGVALAPVPVAPYAPRSPLPDPLTEVGVILSREQARVEPGSGAEACGPPSASLAPEGQSVLAAWQLVNAGWMP